VKDISTDPGFKPWRDEALQRGYASLITLPLTSDGKILGSLNVFAGEPDAFDREEITLLKELADDLAYGIRTQQIQHERDSAKSELENTLRDLRAMLSGTIEAMTLIVKSRDPYTASHEQRVADLARAIATEMGLPKDQITGIRMAGIIHDIGKMSVPSDILTKPIKLTVNEFGIIKAHPEVGYNILKEIEFPWPVAETVHQHHERLDGSGYPQGLSGADILLEAKIMAVADTVEAMASHRPYREALGIDAALEEIAAQRGLLYDAEAVDACIRLFKEKGFELKQEAKLEQN
jgi:putative nucleotidyltransferase with HDIG domain